MTNRLSALFPKENNQEFNVRIRNDSGEEQQPFV